MRLLRIVLHAKGYSNDYNESGGTHESVLWRATLSQALMTLLPVK
jgi:enterochelin esterase-like enzyme